MTQVRLAALVVFAMTAFAANSILCRMALGGTAIDPATFTLVRLVSGALVLAAIVRLRDSAAPSAGDWRSALSLFTYAAAFSYAYVTLSAGTGALLLFGAVQATMILTGLARGDRLSPVQAAGLGLALAGLVALVLPGVTQPSWYGASLMVIAGIAWGLYSLRGRGNASPTATTAGNFLRASLPACVLAVVMGSQRQWDSSGVAYAVLSGALASGVGYALWYSALPFLRPTKAATVQLSVPVLTAMGGVCLLGEALTLRLVLCSAAVLGGIALTLGIRRIAPTQAPVDHES